MVTSRVAPTELARRLWQSAVSQLPSSGTAVSRRVTVSGGTRAAPPAVRPSVAAERSAVPSGAGASPPTVIAPIAWSGGASDVSAEAGTAVAMQASNVAPTGHTRFIAADDISA